MQRLLLVLTGGVSVLISVNQLVGDISSGLFARVIGFLKKCESLTVNLFKKLNNAELSEYLKLFEYSDNSNNCEYLDNSEYFKYLDNSEYFKYLDNSEYFKYLDNSEYSDNFQGAL